MCGPIQFLAVGVPGLEPGTSASQTQRASQLRHTPFAGCKYTIHPRADKAQLQRTDKKEPFVERGGHHKRLSDGLTSTSATRISVTC